MGRRKRGRLGLGSDIVATDDDLLNLYQEDEWVFIPRRQFRRGGRLGTSGSFQFTSIVRAFGMKTVRLWGWGVGSKNVRQLEAATRHLPPNCTNSITYYQLYEFFHIAECMV